MLKQHLVVVTYLEDNIWHALNDLKLTGFCTGSLHCLPE